MKLLDIPLMCRSIEKPGMVDINFDKYEVLIHSFLFA